VTQRSLKLHGGVIVAYERHSHALVQLLTYRLRNRIRLTHYGHANAVEPHKHHHFIIVLSFDDLRRVVMAYEQRGYAIPLLVYIEDPEVLADLNLASSFPGVEIATIPQGNLTDNPEDTLRVTVFHEIIEHLEATTA
jgi:hypothetical protein